MSIKSQKDFVSGLMFAVVGLVFAFGSTSYSLGEGARMGPGYFPLMLGVLLTVLGGLIALKALVAGGPGGDRIGRWAWRPLAMVITANVAFGVLLGGLPSIGLPPMGLMLAIYALTVLASLADGNSFRLKEALILATVLAAGSYVTFIWALKLQMPVWPTFITG